MSTIESPLRRRDCRARAKSGGDNKTARHRPDPLCWPVNRIADLRLAPCDVLAYQGAATLEKARCGTRPHRQPPPPAPLPWAAQGLGASARAHDPVSRARMTEVR